MEFRVIAGMSGNSAREAAELAAELERREAAAASAARLRANLAAQMEEHKAAKRTQASPFLFTMTCMPDMI